MKQRLSPARGFTLVEAIVAIAIIGIIGAIVALFIRLPVQGYTDSVARAELTDAADLALRRIARDLRLALPNSIRVNDAGTSIEFLLTKTGGRYLSAEDGVPDLPVLDFTEPANASFTVVGDFPASMIVPNRDYVVVYNLGEGYEPANAYAALSDPQRNIALITAATSNPNLITMDNNPFGAQKPALPSPGQRFHVVSGPVTYYCQKQADGSHILTRQSGYAATLARVDNPVPVAGSGGQRNLIAGRVGACSFDYSSAENTRNGLVVVTLELQPRNGQEPGVRLVHQVHVSNTP